MVPLPRLKLARFHWLRDAHICPGHASYLGNRIVWQVDRRMGLADGLLVGAGHEAEGLPFIQIHMRGMTESAELFGGFLERVELLEELFFAEFLCRETAFVLVVCIDEVLHGDAPII